MPSDFSARAVYGDSTPPSPPSTPTQSPPRTPSPPRSPPPFTLLPDIPSPPHPLPVVAVYVTPQHIVDNYTTPQSLESLEEGSLQCIICQSEYEEGDTLRILDCGHEFHRDCLDPWLTEFQGVCPLCRADVPSQPTDPSDEEDSDDMTMPTEEDYDCDNKAGLTSDDMTMPTEEDYDCDNEAGLTSDDSEADLVSDDSTPRTVFSIFKLLSVVQN